MDAATIRKVKSSPHPLAQEDLWCWSWRSICVAILAAPATRPQTYTVIHNFTGGLNGGHPRAGLAMDQAGNLYGTAHGGGITGGICGDYGCGTVFKMARKESGWIVMPRYSFARGDDGAHPFMGVTIGADGSLYGTTYDGGGGKSSVAARSST